MNNEPARQIEVSDDAPLRMPVKNFVAILFAVGLSVVAWVTLRAEVTGNSRKNDEQDRRLEMLADKLDQQKEILLDIRADLKRRP